MAEKVHPIENPDENIHTPEEDTHTPEPDTPKEPQDTQNEPQEIVPKVTKPKKAAPEWWNNMKGFFKMLFVTPIVLMQNIFLRIAGGKDAVEKARLDADALSRGDEARRAGKAEGKRMEREINNLLEARIQSDPNFSKDGLTITSVEVYQPETGRQDIQYAIHVKCANESSYAIYMDTSNQLRAASSVPRDVTIQLNELIKDVQLDIVDVTVSEGDPNAPYDPRDEYGQDDETQKSAAEHNNANMSKIINDVQVGNNSWEIDVTRAGETAYINITNKITGEEIKTKAQFLNGAIYVPNTPDALKGAIAQTVYQAYKPLIQKSIDDLRTEIGPEQASVLTQQFAVSAMAGQVYNTTRTLQHSDINEQTPPSTAMYLVPQPNNEITVVTHNTNPAAKKNENVAYLHAYHMDVNNSQNFKFNRSADGKTQSEDIAIRRNLPQTVVSNNIAQWCFNATNATDFQLLIMNEHSAAYTIRADNENNQLVTVVTETHHDGVAMRAQNELTDDQIRNLIPLISSSMPYNENALADAAKILSASVGKEYHDYFMMNNVVMQYDGKSLSFLSEVSNSQVLYKHNVPVNGELTADILDTALSQYHQDLLSHHEDNTIEENGDIEEPSE